MLTRKLMLFLIATVMASATQAQILTPVKWSYAAKRISATEAVVFMKATIDEGWHIYSQKGDDSGPVKTQFTFAPSKGFTLSGSTIEPKPLTKFEKAFKMNVNYFENGAIFQQKIKIKAGAAATVKGKVEFMVCDDTRCLPPDELEFSIPVPAKIAAK